MLKELLNSPQITHAQGRVSTGEKDIVAMLGDQLSQDPEIAKMLMEQGEMPENFQDALKNMSFEDAQKLVESLDQEVGAAELKQAELNQKLQALLPENVTKGEFVKPEGGEQAISIQGKVVETAKSETSTNPLAKILKGESNQPAKLQNELQEIVSQTKQPKMIKEQAALKSMQSPVAQTAPQQTRKGV